MAERVTPDRSRDMVLVLLAVILEVLLVVRFNFPVVYMVPSVVLRLILL